MKKWIILLCVLVALTMSACGKKEPSPPAVPVIEATPTPAPTPTPTPAPTQYTVHNESAEEILALANIPSLVEIDAAASSQYDALLELYRLRPDCKITWNVEFEGNTYPNTAESIKVNNLDGLENALRYLPCLNYVDLIDTNATVEDLDRYSAINPDAFYYWGFEFNGFAIRTDIQCYSTLHGAYEHRYTDEEMYPILKYCKKLRALDIGHNDVTDVTLISELKDLEILIVADNPIVDASPLGKLKDLIYLEIFMCDQIQDFSFLNQLTKLKDINLCRVNNLNNLDFLSNMPDYEFGMYKFTGITEEIVNQWKTKFPNAKFVLNDGDPESCNSGWRDTERNFYIRRNFSGWRHIQNYNTYDDVELISGYVYGNAYK